MLKHVGRFKSWIPFCALVLAAGLSTLYAQDETLADIKYNDDYDRIQRVVKMSDPAKRAERMVGVYKESPDMDPKLSDYADQIFLRDLEALTKQRSYASVISTCERMLKLRPKFGEVYLFYGVALKNVQKFDEALAAFAKCYVIKNPLQTRAKQQLDVAYRATHKGSMVGEDKLIKDAMKGIK
jgi:tetratricopeptide (TPR) repeat protein